MDFATPSRSTVLAASGQADFACKAVQIRRSYCSMGRRRSAPGFNGEPRAPSLPRRTCGALAVAGIGRSLFLQPETRGLPLVVSEHRSAYQPPPHWHEQDVVLTPGNEARLSTAEVPSYGAPEVE